MSSDNKDKITELMKVPYVMIDAGDFSAQSRKRLYWTNIEFDDTNRPTCDLLLKDILEDNVDNKYYVNKEYDFIGEDKQPICMIKQGNFEMSKRVMNVNFKSYTLLASGVKQAFVNNRIRKLTPIEYERLQCLPDDYTKYGVDNKIIADGHRYCCFGNGWNVEVIKYIFKGLL